MAETPVKKGPFEPFVGAGLTGAQSRLDPEHEPVCADENGNPLDCSTEALGLGFDATLGTSIFVNPNNDSRFGAMIQINGRLYPWFGRDMPNAVDMRNEYPQWGVIPQGGLTFQRPTWGLSLLGGYQFGYFLDGAQVLTQENGFNNIAPTELGGTPVGGPVGTVALNVSPSDHVQIVLSGSTLPGQALTNRLSGNTLSGTLEARFVIPTKQRVRAAADIPLPAAQADPDGDGIKGALDLCPNEPEDKDKFEDEDGCIDADNDKDLIPDNADGCPDTPENVNGYQDTDGCPDVKPAPTPAAPPVVAGFSLGSPTIVENNLVKIPFTVATGKVNQADLKITITGYTPTVDHVTQPTSTGAQGYIYIRAWGTTTPPAEGAQVRIMVVGTNAASGSIYSKVATLTMPVNQARAAAARAAAVEATRREEAVRVEAAKVEAARVAAVEAARVANLATFNIPNNSIIATKNTDNTYQAVLKYSGAEGLSNRDVEVVGIEPTRWALDAAKKTITLALSNLSTAQIGSINIINTKDNNTIKSQPVTINPPAAVAPTPATLPTVTGFSLGTPVIEGNLVKIPFTVATGKVNQADLKVTITGYTPTIDHVTQLTSTGAQGYIYIRAWGTATPPAEGTKVKIMIVGSNTASESLYSKTATLTMPVNQARVAAEAKAAAEAQAVAQREAELRAAADAKAAAEVKTRAETAARVAEAARVEATRVAAIEAARVAAAARPKPTAQLSSLPNPVVVPVSGKLKFEYTVTNGSLTKSDISAKCGLNPIGASDIVVTQTQTNKYTVAVTIPKNTDGTFDEKATSLEITVFGNVATINLSYPQIPMGKLDATIGNDSKKVVEFPVEQDETFDRVTASSFPTEWKISSANVVMSGTGDLSVRLVGLVESQVTEGQQFTLTLLNGSTPVKTLVVTFKKQAAVAPVPVAPTPPTPVVVAPPPAATVIAPKPAVAVVAPVAAVAVAPAAKPIPPTFTTQPADAQLPGSSFDRGSSQVEKTVTGTTATDVVVKLPMPASMKSWLAAHPTDAKPFSLYLKTELRGLSTDVLGSPSFKLALDPQDPNAFLLTMTGVKEKAVNTGTAFRCTVYLNEDIGQEYVINFSNKAQQAAKDAVETQLAELYAIKHLTPVNMSAPNSTPVTNDKTEIDGTNVKATIKKNPFSFDQASFTLPRNEKATTEAIVVAKPARPDFAYDTTRGYSVERRGTKYLIRMDGTPEASLKAGEVIDVHVFDGSEIKVYHVKFVYEVVESDADRIARQAAEKAESDRVADEEQSRTPPVTRTLAQVKSANPTLRGHAANTTGDVLDVSTDQFETTVSAAFHNIVVPKITAAYTTALKTNPKIKDTLTIRFTIKTDGTADNITVTSMHDAQGLPDLLDSIIKAIYSSFVTRRLTESTTVEWTLPLSAAE